MNFYVTILGSGAALPTGRRRCSAQVVNVNGFKLLLDCAGTSMATTSSASHRCSPPCTSVAAPSP